MESGAAALVTDVTSELVAARDCCRVVALPQAPRPAAGQAPRAELCHATFAGSLDRLPAA
jgi:hypothetical protein